IGLTLREERPDEGRGEHLLDEPLVERAEEHALALEVRPEGLHRDACALGDLVDGGVGESLPSDDELAGSSRGRVGADGIEMSGLTSSPVADSAAAFAPLRAGGRRSRDLRPGPRAAACEESEA